MDKDYRKAFFFCKRWAKSPLTAGYTIGYSRGIADKEPAKIVYDYILFLQGEKIYDFKEKLDLLDSFLEKKDKEEDTETNFRSGFYKPIRHYINGTRINIKKGFPVQTKRP